MYIEKYLEQIEEEFRQYMSEHPPVRGQTPDPDAAKRGIEWFTKLRSLKSELEPLRDRINALTQEVARDMMGLTKPVPSTLTLEQRITRLENQTKMINRLKQRLFPRKESNGSV